MLNNQKPILPVTGKPLISNKPEYIRFMAAWKQVVADDRAQQKLGYKSNFAALMIFRNIALGDDVFTGFTPMQRINNLKNGRTFLDGWLAAYQQLYRSITQATSGNINNIALDIAKLMNSPQEWRAINFKSFEKELISPSKFFHFGTKSYVRRIHDKLVADIESGTFTRAKTITELFDRYEDQVVFSFIPRTTIEKFNERSDKTTVLKSFAKAVLELEGNSVIHDIQSIELLETDTPVDGNTHSIFIKTKRAGAKNYQQYHLPFNCLWESEWMAKYKK